MAADSTNSRGSTTSRRNIVDANSAATSMVCLVLVVILLVPVAPGVILWISFDNTRIEGPGNFLLMLLKIAPTIEDELNKINGLLIPIFAVAAGLQSRRQRNSWFFLILVAFCLCGVICSLLSGWFVQSDSGAEILMKDNWIGPGPNEFAKWQPKAISFYQQSFHTFISYIAILLGLEAASRGT